MHTGRPGGEGQGWRVQGRGGEEERRISPLSHDGFKFYVLDCMAEI